MIFLLGDVETCAVKIKSFMRADLLIAPHGAAIGLCGFMRPGGAVIEIGYPLRRWPAVFMPVALSAGLKYYLHLADKGKHSGPLQAGIGDVVKLAVMAAKDMGRFNVKGDPGKADWRSSESRAEGLTPPPPLKPKCK